MRPLLLLAGINIVGGFYCLTQCALMVQDVEAGVVKFGMFGIKSIMFAIMFLMFAVVIIIIDRLTEKNE